MMVSKCYRRSKKKFAMAGPQKEEWNWRNQPA